MTISCAVFAGGGGDLLDHAAEVLVVDDPDGGREVFGAVATGKAGARVAEINSHDLHIFTPLAAWPPGIGIFPRGIGPRGPPR